MRIFYAGDVVGQVGVEALTHWLPRLRAAWRLDAIVVNAENSATGGKGVTPPSARALLQAGADVLTGGNHSFSCPEIAAYQAKQPRLLRPANTTGSVGAGSVLLALPNKGALWVAQVQGRLFMPGKSSCPFAAVDALLHEASLGAQVAKLVDVHAEATSEKQALAWHLAGRVSAVVGSHTHVPTADGRLLKSTAYLSDAGMCGPYESVVGFEADAALARFLRQAHDAAPVAQHDVRIAGVVIDVCDRSGEARRIHSVVHPATPHAPCPTLPWADDGG